VFEGSASAEFSANVEFNKMLATPVETGFPTVWLGDPIAIKEPTVVTFRPYSGANLLLLGQSEEAALATLTSAFVALATRLRPSSPGVITMLDGTPDDSEYADHLRRVSYAIGLPTASKTRAELPAAIHQLALEVDRRLKNEVTERSPRFLIIHGLQRLRELRKAEDDFGYGRRGEKVASPAEEFGTILREGPAVGVHIIAWCDSITNLTRAVDRAGMREFNLRVLFQMNPNDSAQLIDTPAASKLGRNRALYIEEGLERPEKFRPYGLCRFDWLRKVGETLALEESNETPPASEPISEGAALTS
jgi:S-DNA-T family DNA segregation ATPase FtsK/SpoIIIE